MIDCGLAGWEIDPEELHIARLHPVFY